MTNTNATYATSIAVDLPDYPAATVTFTNTAFFVSGNSEVLPGKQYTLTLNSTGQGTQTLPCPDNTGDAAVNWRINLPSKESGTYAIAYDAATQQLSDILAAQSTTADPDAITAAIAGKMDKVAGGIQGHAVEFASGGQVADAGFAFGTAAAADVGDFDAAGAAATAQAAAEATAAALVDDLSGVSVTKKATARANIGAMRLPAYPLATAQTSSNTNNAMLYMPQDDYTVTAVWTPLASQILTISLRWTDYDNRYFIYARNDTNEIYLYKRVGGSQSVVTSKGGVGFSTGVASTIKAVVRGTNITVFVGGVYMMQATDTSLPTGRGVHYSANGASTTAAITVTPFDTASERRCSVNAADTMRIYDPQPRQVMQRNATTGDILIHGAFNHAGGPYTVEASFNGGAYQDIVTGHYGGYFYGKLTGQTAGNGTLTVRLKEATSVSGTVANVGVGDVYVIAGQSNASGKGTNNQTYSHATLIASMLGNDYQWKNLTDPTDSASYAVDTVSSVADSAAAGSVWPLVMQSILDNQSVPVAIIPCAHGGSSIDSWRPGANHEDRTTLYGSMVYRAKQAGGCKAVLWWQGEADPNKSTGEYYAALMELADAIRQDLGCTIMPAKLQNSSGISDALEANLRTAVGNSWANSGNVATGPDLSGLNSDDSYHIMTNVNLAAAAALWYAAIAAAFY